MAKQKVISKDQVVAVLPLGPLQQGMLFHYLMQEKVDNYFQQLCYSITGELNIDALENAWNQVIRQNEALRTIYRWEQLKNPIQIILKEQPIQIDFHDLTSVQETERESKVQELKERDRQRGIDLANGPTMRVMLCKLADSEYEMIWTHHHIMLDGWCLGIIFKELFVAYLQLQKGQAPGFVSKARYKDYLKWIQQQKKAEALDFWRGYLRGFTAPTALPADQKTRGMVERAELGRVELDFDLSKRLEAFAKSEKITVNVLIQAAWAIILQRYNLKNDVVFGSTVAGRPADLPGVEEIVGLFINTVPVRVQTEQTGSCLELLQEINQSNIERQNYEYIGLSDIKGESEVDGQQSLFNSIVVYENYPVDRALAELDLGFKIAGKSAFEMTNYDLTILGLQTDHLIIEYIYNPDVFTPATIERLGQQFVHILEQVLEKPEQELQKVKVIPAEEEELVTVKFNATYRDYPVDQNIHQVFEEQVALYPDKVAVSFGNERLSYTQLNKQANQLAHYLRCEGVGPDSLVGLMVERSLDMVVAILGILKAGGAYLPLDPAYPENRLAFMLEDTKAPLLITQSSIAEMIPDNYRGEVLILDDSPKLATMPVDNLSAVSGSRDLAYVMYTSGSTGQPKGVLIEQRSVLRLVKNTNYIKLTPADRILQAAPYSFDAATLEIWGALLSGGQLCLISQDKVFSMQELGAEIQQLEITTLWLTASLFNRMIDENPESLRGLKYLLAGGEALSVPHVTRALELLPKTQLINGYGPTENTTFTCCYQIKEIGDDPWGISIGSPIANTRVYIVDANNQPVPIGFPGELCIAGEGLARGYLNRPALTAEKFVANPFEPGGKMYRSGDLAAWTLDGNIAFLGRVDDQVKIRGFRIEPGEIEKVLATHPKIQQVVVMPRSSDQGNTYLAAYLEAVEDVTSAELREFLLHDLPEYMIPAVFVTLEQLPLNPNGKVDRKELPDPRGMIETGVRYLAPRNEQEEQIAGIWAEVLGVKRVGIQDNFFDLGGDSIKAIQVVSRMGKVGLHCKVKDIFTLQTVEKLADNLNTDDAPIAEQGQIRGEAGLGPVQHWFMEQALAKPDHWNQSLFLRLKGEIQPGLLKSALQKIWEHHDGLRLYCPTGEKLVYDDQLDAFELEIYDLQDLEPEEEKQVLFSLGSQLKASFQLKQSPLFKAALFKLTGDETRLLLTAHHLVVDGVSWRIILEDLQDSYLQLQAEKEIQLPLKTTSWQEWVQKLTEYGKKEEIMGELPYWEEVLARARAFPTDRGTGLDTYENTVHYQQQLTSDETRILLTKTHGTYNTEMNDLLLAALARSIRNWIGWEQVVIRLEGHGREEILPDVDISRTVGWFTTMYPVLLNLQGMTNLGEEVKGIKEQLRKIPNRGIGYGILKYITGVQELQGEEPATISFNYLGQLDHQMHSELFEPASEEVGPETDECNQQLALLDLSGFVLDDQLKITVNYSKNRYHQKTIVAFLENYMAELRKIIHHCNEEEGCYTPADFPLAELSQSFLNRVDKKEVEDIYGLSPMQEGMIYHYMLDPTASNYLEQFCFSIVGELDLRAFQQAWNHLIQDHPVLRTIFKWNGLKRPVQMVLKELSLELTVHDLRHLDQAAQKEALVKWKADDQRNQFSLETGPNLRVEICQLGDEAYEVIWTFHHILLDGWCLGILFKELFAAYTALLQGKEPTKNQKRPFRDYIGWLKEQDRQKAREFWKDYLAGFDEPTPLPVDGQKQGIISESEKETLQLGVEMTRQLQELARQEKVTVNTLLQMAWGILLQKFNYTDDVVFGATVSGRPTQIRGIEEMVGLFINTLPVRVKSSKGESMMEVARRLHNQNVRGQDFAYLSLIEIMEAGKWPTSRPLFSSMIAFENYPIDETIDRLDVGFRVENATSFEMTNFDLTLIATLGRDLNIDLIYNRDLFTSGTIQDICKHLVRILQVIVEEPEICYEEFQMISPAAYQQMTGKYNDTATDYPRESIQEVFEAQVRAFPEKLALSAPGQCYTYRELNMAANRLAHRLKELGVTTESMVGLLMERRAEMIIATLAILKAGGAYVPLDPDYPQERIRFMLEDIAAPLVLAERQLKGVIPASYTGQTLLVEDIEQEKLTKVENPEPISGPEDLAYVMYTSGSSGRPKGVMVEQKSVIRLVKQTNYLQLDEQDKLLQSAPYSFDAATLEIWGALLCGGELHLIEREKLFSMSDLASEIKRLGITTLWLTASLFNRMVDESIEELEGVQNLLAGGEALSLTHVQKALTALPGTQLINGYGPTENTTFTCCYPIQEITPGQKSVPIGKPIANTRVYILDRYLNPLPPGLPGELCIAGEGLARGYLNRPELTAEKFVSHPFVPGERIYRSGDLVRYLPDGTIEFLGRVDQQVKIRGFRIEPGEIEKELQSHPAITGAVVIPKTDQRGDKYLAAYIVSEEELSVKELRSYLLERMPEYMIPNLFVPLAELPLSPNGKVDYRALPEPKETFSTGVEYAPAESKLEKALTDIWKEILGVEKIGIDDDFFELGGHSLKMIQLMSRINEITGEEYPLAIFYENPTIRELAVALEEKLIRQNSNLIRLKAGQTEKNVFCIHPGDGIIDYYRPLAGLLTDDYHVYALHARGLGGEAPLPMSVEEIATDYIREIQTVQPEGPYTIIGWCVGGAIGYEIVRQLRQGGDEISRFFIMDARSLDADQLDPNETVRQDFLRVLEKMGVPLEAVDGYSLEEIIDFAYDKEIATSHEKLQSVSIDNFKLHTQVRKNLIHVCNLYQPDSIIQDDIYFIKARETDVPFVDWKTWRAWTEGDIHHWIVPGDHMSMFEEPNVVKVAEIVNNLL